MTSPDKPASTVQPGDILAEKYRVERVLGQGGMGVVVLAEHIELRERVAIKFLLDTPADNAELAERFVREARAAVKIKSEHVVRVIDVGRLPTGAPYMVMEYLEGEDLSQRLMSGRVPIEDAVDYVIQSCEAMQVAHRTGIVHRDLKPANLFLTQRPDGSSLIKVLDFGISKVKSADAAQLSLTHTQAMMGSPLYMSPEQMRSSKDVSPSADIWSLGVILHELIAGDVPFTGTTFPEVLVQVMSEPPPKLRTLRPEVPEGLEAAVLRCLEKDPADRFSSVANLAVALTPYASSRTLGLQARLRASVSRPAPALAVPAIKLIQSTQVVVDGPMIGLPEAVAPTSPAPAPDPSSALAAPVIVAAREHAKTNTAWAEQSAGAATRSGGARRIGLIAAGALGVVGLIAAVLLRPSANGSSAAPAASPPPAALAAPAHEAPAADSSLKPAPKIMPLVEPPPTSAEPPAPAASASGDAPSEPRAAAAAPDEHTSAAAPTATSPEPVSAPATAPRPAARRSQPKASTEASARARAGAAASSKPAPGAAATPPPRPAAHKPAKSKPLSIEFK